MDRPVLQEMLADLSDGDIVLVQRLDRLSRDQIDRMVIKAEITSAGATLQAVRQQFDDTPEGWLTENIDALMSQYEVKKIGLRTKIVLRRKAERGDLVTAPPYGYHTLDREAGGRVEWGIVEDEAATIRLIDSLYLDGWGGQRIANHLNERATASPSGGQWSAGGVRAIVARETYTGIIEYGRERWEKHRRAGKGDPVRSVVDIEPIRSVEVWDRIKAERERRNVNPGRARRRSPFGSVLRCGVCGGGMQVETSGGIYHSYICSTAKTTGKCVRNSISERKLVGLIRGEVDAAGHEDLVATVPGPDVARAEKDLAAVDMRRQRLITAYESGALPLDDLLPRLERLSVRRDELEMAIKAEPVTIRVPISVVMLDDREALVGWVDDAIDYLVWSKDAATLEIRFKAPT